MLLDMVAQESGNIKAYQFFLDVVYYKLGLHAHVTQSVGGQNEMYVRGVGNQAYVAPYTSGPGP
jgi:hypothetical protein